MVDTTQPAAGATTERASLAWLGLGFGVLWAILVIGGFARLALYQNTPGPGAGDLASWPEAAGVEPSAAVPTLVLFVHPRCPCSRATLEELGRIMARCAGRLEARALFIRPCGTAAGWERTDLWHAAERIPGVLALVDEDGREARRFGARTSGQAMLFDTAGRLLFGGGITGSRGHAGDNAGKDAIIAMGLGEASRTVGTPVFGCPLFDDAPNPEEEDSCCPTK